jgi:chaperonin GroEL
MPRRIALLVGNQTFIEDSELQPLRAPINDVNALTEIFEDPARGNFKVHCFIDKPHYEVMKAVVETLQSVNHDDFVLIYYSGHGKIGPSGRLYLATSDTTRTALQATAVSAWSLHEAVQDSLCQQVVLLLDCCYSGAVSQGVKGDVDSQLQLVKSASGFFILTASTSIQTALESEVAKDGKVMSRFTEAIVEGIRSGKADQLGTGEIHLRHIKEYVEKHVRGHTPQFFAHASTGDPLISGSRRPVIDARILADLNDEAWPRRLEAVKNLVRLMRSGRPEDKEASRAALATRRATERDVDVCNEIDTALQSQELSAPTGNSARMLRGINTLANAVKVTLGPRGRKVVIGRASGKRQWTKHGLLIAKEIGFTERFENLGAQMLITLASDTQEKAGDGTTTAIVLAQAMIIEGLKLVASGMNPGELHRGMEDAVPLVTEEIGKNGKLVTARDEVARVAFLASGDEAAGEIVASAIAEIEDRDLIAVEEGDAIETEVELAEAKKIPSGYVSPYFITDEKRKVAELNDAYILICDSKLTSLQPLLPLLEKVVESASPLLIVAQDVEGEALATLVVNKLRGGLKVAAVKARRIGRRALLQEIAVLTGGQVINDQLGIQLENVTLDMLGRAKMVRVESQLTAIIPHETRVGKSSDRRRTSSKRLDQAAIIRVGGNTEAEIKEKKDRIYLALNAARNAMEEGVVAGGGIALLKAQRALREVKGESMNYDGGIQIVRQALRAPLRQMLENAGINAPTVIETILENASPTFGFDVIAKKYVDMVEAGIIDRAKVVRTTLEEAASVAGMIITTEPAILLGAQKSETPPEMKSE